MARSILVVSLLVACGGAHPPPPPPPVPAHPAEVVFRGMCDASGAVALSPDRLLVADDEDNVLRLYDAVHGGEPLAGADVSAALGLARKGKRRPHFPELDLEAATTLGDRAFWITSHGRARSGKVKPERLRIFATTLPADGDAAAIEVLGSYDGLLDDLLADPRYETFDLAQVDIEGLTATPDGDLLIGFRNPTPGGRALIAPLRAPDALLDGAGPARFGDPILLALGGEGIRSLSWWHGRYLIAATGPRLFTWDGDASLTRVDVPLDAYNPEGFFSPEERDEILLLSDDGTVMVDDVPCKQLDDPARRSFRGAWVRVPEPG